MEKLGEPTLVQQLEELEENGINDTLRISARYAIDGVYNLDLKLTDTETGIKKEARIGHGYYRYYYAPKPETVVEAYKTMRRSIDEQIKRRQTTEETRSNPLARYFENNVSLDDTYNLQNFKQNHVVTKFNIMENIRQKIILSGFVTHGIMHMHICEGG